MAAESVTEEKSLVERIESDIFAGKLAPGMWLKQIDLEERYGCSRLSLRHALEQLQSRKIVERVPNRGFYVPRIDETFVNNVVQARAFVEASIVDVLVTNITDESLAKLSYLAAQFAETVRTGTISEQDEANLAFHREMLRNCPNQVMNEMILALRRRVPLNVQRMRNTPAHMERSAMDHFQMVEALRQRNADALREIIVRHVMRHVTKQD